MGFFKRKKTPDVRVLSSGDIVLINDAAFLVTSRALIQLPVYPVNQNKPQQEEGNQ